MSTVSDTKNIISNLIEEIASMALEMVGFPACRYEEAVNAGEDPTGTYCDACEYYCRCPCTKTQ